MKRGDLILCSPAAIAALLLAAACAFGFAQKAQEPAPAQPAFDPLRAEKDLEVGRYYMKKGDVDAAIDRFQDATQARPNLAEAYLLLADAQEKKGLKTKAIASYQRYLDILPHADNANKIRARIAKLRKEAARETTAPGSN
jgi:tetratricopeptide (TPR) repeat protein